MIINNYVTNLHQLDRSCMHETVLTVCRDFDFFRQLGNIHLESILYIIQSFRIGFIRNESNRQTFSTKTAGPSNLETET